MKILLLALLEVIFLLDCTIIVAMNPLENRKQNFFPNSYLTRDGSWKSEFQLSLRTPSAIKQTWNYLLAGVPVIGHYQNTGYEFRTRFALVETHSDSAKTAFSESLKRALVPGYSLNTYIMITGRGLRDFAYYNMVFHPVVAVWQGYNSDFNVNAQMGLFVPNGIVPFPPSIAFDSLSSQNVHSHDYGVFLSPDNAHFAIMPNRSISTFWSAVVSDQAPKNIVVTFHILVNDTNLEETVKDKIKHSNNLGQLLDNLEKIQLINQPDAQALGNALGTIRAMATGAPAQPFTVPVSSPVLAPIPVVSDQKLQQELRNLIDRLNELQRVLAVVH